MERVLQRDIGGAPPALGGGPLGPPDVPRGILFLEGNGIGGASPPLGAGPHGPPSMPRRILIVEDNDMARRDLQRLLQESPQFEVDATGDGEEGLALLAENDYSLVLPDLRLPGLHGIEFLQ